MTDATQSDATQADVDAQSQADTTSQTNDTAQADVKDVTAETISLDEAKKLRSEAASLRKRLKDAETRVQTFEAKTQTEAEKREAAFQEAQERANKAEERARTALGKAAVLAAAPKANVISPKAAYASIRHDLEFDDETGEPTNVNELLNKLKVDDPDLFRAHSADGGKGAPPAGNDFNQMIRRAAGRK